MRSGAFLVMVGLMGASALGASPARAECSATQLQEADNLRKAMRGGTYLNQKWAQLDAQYRRLEATTCELNDIDFNFGGIAARGLGEIGLALERFKKIRSASTTYADLRARYGKVTLDAVKATKLARTAGPSLDADGVAALQLVTAKLDLKGGFDGYLPLGTYAIGDKQFTVTVNGEVTVAYNPKAGWTVRGP